MYLKFATHAVMRGCVDRFLLFGLDEDVRDALVDRSECRATDRQLLHLVSLSPDTDLVLVCSCTGTLCNDANMDHVVSSSRQSVLVCSCTGTLCNDANMDHVVSSSRQSVIPLISLLIITTLLTSYSMWNI
uniref:UPAR/Ly6 domain-containing protein n=1 Tax=Ascaris lumbricoides TaxID=6252 RepID=A0A9J2PWS4_ASCLU